MSQITFLGPRGADARTLTRSRKKATGNESKDLYGIQTSFLTIGGITNISALSKIEATSVDLVA